MNRNSIIALIILTGVAYGIGRYLQPAEVITKEVVKEVEVIKKDVKIVERIIKRPDGTIIEDRTTEDRTSTEIKKETDKSTQIVALKPQWHIHGMAGTSVRNFGEINYGFGVERRILGSLFVGVYANTKQEVGLSAGYEL